MNLLDLMVTISVNSEDVEEEIKKAKGQFEELGEEGKNLGGQIGAADVALGNLLSSVAKWGAQRLVDMAKTGVMYNAQIETYTTALTTALGSEAEAAAAIEQIKQDAARTPYSVDGLVKANTYLIQAGESAEDARETILALTDAVSASGGGNEELQRTAQNLQQIKNVGKATAQDIRQFAIAGIDIYGILADYTGLTTEEVKELDVSYELLSGALRAAAEEGGRFYGANAAQAETLNGQLSTLSDNINNTLGNAFTGVSELLSGTVLPAVNGFLEGLDPTEATTLVLELAAGVGAVGVAALKSSGMMAKLLAALGPTMAAIAPIAAATAVIVGMTAAVIDGVNAFDSYVEEITTTDGSLEGMTARLEELRAKEEELKAQMDSGWSSEMTYMEYDATRLAIAQLEGQIASYTETSAEAAETTEGMAEATEGVTETVSEQEAALQGLRAAYVDAFETAKTEVSSWYKLFQEADEIQAASLAEMAANVQSQINFNQQYQQSLENLAEHGYGDVAAQIAALGSEGANYAVALSQALDSGNTEQVETIAALLETLTGTQESLAGTITDTSGKFDELLQTLAEGTKEPYKIILEDNAADVAAGVNESLATIPDETVKYITMVTDYTDGGADVDSHNAQGLSYVPFDGYVASLHRGERIMTASENREYSGGGISGIQLAQITLPISLELDGEVLARRTYSYTQQLSGYEGERMSG